MNLKELNDKVKILKYQPRSFEGSSLRTCASCFVSNVKSAAKGPSAEAARAGHAHHTPSLFKEKRPVGNSP